MNKPENVYLSDDSTAVIIIDQTLLPGETRLAELREPEELFEAIKSLRVRGAPAIGIFAAYALYVLARQIGAEHEDAAAFNAKVRNYSDMLASARPTAVNLAHSFKG